MFDRIIDESNPRYRGPLPKPRGLLPVPPEIAEEVSREQASQQPFYTDDYAKLTRDDWTLRYYYEGETVACRSTPEGVEVLAVGSGGGPPVLRGDAARETARRHDQGPLRRRSHEPSRSPSPAPDAPRQGDTVLWADLVLSLKTNRGTWEEVSFRVDSGTEMTTMPAFRAMTLDLPIPKNPVSGLALYGQRSSGLLRRGSSAWIQPNSSFPATSSATRMSSLPPQARNLLGLTGSSARSASPSTAGHP